MHAITLHAVGDVYICVCVCVTSCTDPNRDFLTYLFCDDGFALQFLKDVGLLRSKVQCNTCGRDMTWSPEPSIPGRFRWRCRRKVAGVKCLESRSIKHGSWFQQSNLTFTRHVRHHVHEPARHTKEDYCLSSSTIADWDMFCRGTMLVLMEGCLEKVSGPR